MKLRNKKNGEILDDVQYRNFSMHDGFGLRNQDGKEIYEGDIVTLTGEWEEIEYDDCYIIAFENGCFRVGDGYENEAGHYLSDWRIIGNIHENPELLYNKSIKGRR